MKTMGRAALLIVLTLCATAEVKADTESDFTFNSGVRYSQWVTKSRMTNFYRNTTQDGFAVYNENGTKTADGHTAFDYVPGLVAKAIVENVEYYSQFDWAQSWAEPFFYNMAGYCNAYYNSVPTGGGSLDNLNASKMFFGIYNLTKTGGAYASKSIASTTNSHAQTALGKAVTGFGAHNSGYKIGTSTPAYEAGHTIVEGGWYHKSTYVDEMWLDGSYMGPALFAQLRNYNGSNIIGDDWTIAYRQIQALWEMCWNPTDKLLYHAFAAKGYNNYSNTWAGFNPDGGVYHSASYWGRACGWYFLALIDILEQMDKAGLNGTDNYNTLKSHLSDLAAGLAARQDAATGCWYQILDEDGTFHASTYQNGKNASKHSDTHNYIESSASALFTAGYLKAMRLGYLSKSTYEAVAKKGYEGLVNNFFAADGSEGVHLFGSCRSAGLGGAAINGDKWRDGSKAYYLLGHDVDRVAKSENVTEGKIFGAFVLAATEYEREYQNNTVLFEKDLAPSYSLDAGDEISCPASGSGATITYQWYKDGTAVDGATNATIAPTASGEYYCKATSGSTTIQSSTTTVTVAGDDTFTPEFTTNLASTATATEGVAKTLTVAADHVDGYQWYSNTTASNTGGQTISGATSASYTFTPNATGTLYYYCVATNSKATGTKSVASAVCTVTVSEAPEGPTVLYSTDFSNSEWSGITNICNSSNAANETYNGITFHSYNSTAKPFVVNQSAGTMTWCNNNMGNNFWIAIPVTGVNGSLTITVDNGSTATRFNYVIKQETSVSGSPGSGSSTASADPSTVTIENLGESNYVVYLGRQGSGLTTLTSITITTPASTGGGDTPTPTTYTVSYNMNGHGSAIADVTGATALPSTLPTPEATGYIFGGWYTNEGLTTAAVAGASISDNTTLYAKWTEEIPTTSYTVKFYNGETQFGNAQTIEEGATVSAPATNPTKEGYTFKGWALSDGSTARVLFPYPIYDNVNFYAVWSNTTSGGSGSGETETIFSAVATTALSVTKGTTDNNLSDNATITGGSMYANNGETSDKDMIKTQSKVMAFQLPNSSTIFKVTLNKALEAGDKINAETQTRTDTEVGLWLLTSTSRPKSAPAATMTLATASTAEWVSLPEYTVETGDGICGETTFYIHRCVGKTVYFTNFTITREGEAVGSDITLETVSDYEDFESYAGEGKTVTFKRNFTEGNWTTLVLPFNVTAAQLGAAFEYANECELANIQSMTVNEQGTGSIRYVTTSSITANKPVLAKIKPNDGLSGGSFTANEYVFSGVTVVNPANASAIAATSTDGNVTMYGVYKTTSYTDIDEDSYYISGGKFYDWSYLNSMAPFTAYLLPTGANTQSVKSISFADNATGINETLRYENETSLRDYESSVNLAGQKVGKGYKGIVIKNGAKVVQ